MNVSSAPMSGRRIVQELLVLCASYLLGLWVLLIGLTDLPAGQLPSLAVGLVIVLAASAAVLAALGRRRPLPGARRPPVMWLPLGVALAIGLWWLAGLQDPTTPDVASFAALVPLLIVGRLVSNLWWSVTASAGRSSPR